MAHPFLEWDGEGAIPWRIVADFMDMPSLVYLSVANRSFGQFVNGLLEDDLIWKKQCFDLLGVPLQDHPEIDRAWRDIYISLIGNPNLVGGIFVEGSSLIATGRLNISALTDILENEDCPKGDLINNVRSGLWVINVFVPECVVHDQCGLRDLSLSAYALEFYMTPLLDSVQLDLNEDVPNTSVDCGIFVPSRLHEPSSLEIATPEHWRGENWETVVNRAPYAVGFTQRTPDLLGTHSITEFTSVEGEVVNISIVSHLPEH